MMCTNNRVHYDLMVVHGYLHITLLRCHHYADLSECIELLKCCQIYLFCLECVSKIRSVLSITFYTIYGAMCIQFTHFSMMTVRIPVLDLIIIVRSEVWPICHCLRLGHKNNGLCTNKNDTLGSELHYNRYGKWGDTAVKMQDKDSGFNTH